MILATENFKSDNWSIRNSALMCFTSLTKRLLRTTNVQDQDLSRKKGLSIWEFVARYEELSEYFKASLRSCLAKKKQSKEIQERSDMVIFSILLFISRLVPAFQLVDSQNVKAQEEEGAEDESEKQIESGKAPMKKSQDQSIHEFVGLIKAYAKSGTYFVRKISAQALLPIMSFEQYIEEIKGCFQTLADKVERPKESKLRQNEAHGLMIRVSIFLSAYFTYRGSNLSISGRSIEEEDNLQKSEDKELTAVFQQFQERLPGAEAVFSKIIIALFVKINR